MKRANLSRSIALLLAPALTLSWASAPLPAWSMPRKAAACAAPFQRGDTLTTAESFLLHVSKRVATGGRLPQARDAIARLKQLEPALGAEGEAAATASERYRARFAEVLGSFDGLTPEDWSQAEEARFESRAPLGSARFLDEIEAARQDSGAPLTDAQKRIFRKLNSAADSVMEHVRAFLSQRDAGSFQDAHRFLSEQELVDALRAYTRDPSFALRSLGFASLGEWRARLFTTDSALRKALEKSLLGAVKDYVERTQEIPEKDQELVRSISRSLGMSEAEVAALFGADRIFPTVAALVEKAQAQYSSTFAMAVDKRVFTQAKTDAMLKAIRESRSVILFKLVENQEVADFEAVEQLAKAQGAPIVVAPAFSEVGLIPQTMKWLFDRPNVHVLVDKGIQLDKGFYVLNNGAADKDINPLMGLEQIHQPTDRVIVFHPRVRTLTRATGTYDLRPGYMMTTGSMSKPAYRGRFAQERKMDHRAQVEAEGNRGVTILTRGYENRHFAPLVGAAQAAVPRRAQYAQAHYGNPAGLFDLGKIYSAEGIKEIDFLPAVVLGDIHLGVTEPRFLNAFKRMMAELKIVAPNPRYGQFGEYEFVPGPVRLGAVVLHDFIDGTPTNRHTMDALITRAIEDEQGALDLERHLRQAAAFANRLLATLPPGCKIVIPSDNHGNDWIGRKLQEGDLFKGHRGKEVPLVLRMMMDAITSGANMYERVFQYYGIDSDRVDFVPANSTYRIGIDLENLSEDSLLSGTEIGQHSQNGVNGAKSISIQKLLSAYGAMVAGHTHSTSEFGQARRVGTGTPIPQGYMRGPSGNDVSLALVYAEEATQILRMEKGSFLPNGGAQDPRHAYPSDEWPRVLKWENPPEGGTQTSNLRANPPRTRTRIGG